MELSEITGNNEVITLSDITGQFKTKTQRQDFYEPQPDDGGPDDGLAALADPDGTALSEETEEESQPIDPERARRTGMRIARVVDTAFSFAASSFIAPGSDNEYRADDKDLEDIGECWGEIAEDKGWSMSPSVQLVFLYAIVYGPLLKSALDDRRIMQLEQRQRETEQRQVEHGDRIGQLESELERLRGERGGEAKS